MLAHLPCTSTAEQRWYDMDNFFNLSQFKDRIAVVDEEKKHYSYGFLRTLCEEMEAHLPGKGKKLGFLLSRNNIETLMGYLALIRRGHAVNLVDHRINQSLLRELIKNYDPDFTWRPKGGLGQAVYCFGDYELEQRMPGEGKPLHPDVNLLLSTSGSTGSPKLVKLTGANIIANARSIARYLHLNETERPVTMLPFHYSYGLSVINSHLLVGATLIMTDESVVRAEFWDLFKTECVTSLVGVPYTYEMLKKLGFSRMNLPSLRYMTQAGGKLGHEYILEFARFSRRQNVDFYVMYGQTEATARISYLPPENNISKCKSIGISIPDGELWISDDEGNAVKETHKEGELVYRGPNVMMGYAEKKEDLCRGDELKSVLKTKDIAYFDEDGYFYISGRKGRFLKILGNRVNLVELENHLRNMGFDCACGGQDDLIRIAVTDKSVFQKIKKVVVEKFGFQPSLVEVFQVKEILKNSSGKIQYKELFK
jgi:acyl-coenzyme A synthetase/AMP-(fatty) acid ligase